MSILNGASSSDCLLIKEDFRLNLVDVKKIRERCTIYHPKEKTYETLKTLGFSYGEDLQILGNG
jgi:hypothetical protein